MRSSDVCFRKFTEWVKRMNSGWVLVELEGPGGYSKWHGAKTQGRRLGRRPRVGTSAYG